jgi:hypothetical protein
MIPSLLLEKYTLRFHLSAKVGESHNTILRFVGFGREKYAKAQGKAISYCTAQEKSG